MKKAFNERGGKGVLAYLAPLRRGIIGPRP